MERSSAARHRIRARTARLGIVGGAAIDRGNGTRRHPWRASAARGFACPPAARRRGPGSARPEAPACRRRAARSRANERGSARRAPGRRCCVAARCAALAIAAESRADPLRHALAQLAGLDFRRRVEAKLDVGARESAQPTREASDSQDRPSSATIHRPPVAPTPVPPDGTRAGSRTRMHRSAGLRCSCRRTARARRRSARRRSIAGTRARPVRTTGPIRRPGKERIR